MWVIYSKFQIHYSLSVKKVGDATIKQEIRFCQTKDGVRLAYAIAGNGPPLVKAANWLSHIEYEWHCPVWRNWYEELTKYFTVIRYDQRGCGLSDLDVETITFRSWVQDLRTVVNAAGLKKFSLLGIAQGGAVAAAFTHKNPQRVSHLILYGAYLRGRHNRNLSSKKKEETKTFIDLIRLGWGSKKPAYRQVFTSLITPEATLEQIKSLNELHKQSTTAENAVRIVNCFDRINVETISTKIKTPTLIMHAKDDAHVSFEEGRLAASLIPEAQFIQLNSKNHILLKSERSWKKFISSLLYFVKTKKVINLSSLSNREKEVLEFIAQGFNNNQIAEKLFISPLTVRNHITNIFGKLGIDNRPEVIVFAREAGLGYK
jgi:pimeloyl-ACP methyl ester carboxylesterase/DNA-binding CsgD family transcriptional regulator